MTTMETTEIDSRDKLYNTILQKLEVLSAIKFVAYRVACKLRTLQKYLKLTYVDYNVLVRAFNTHQLQFGVETRMISSENARKVLIAIYQLISPYHFNELSIEETVETLLIFLREILHVKSDDDFGVNSFKIIIFALSSAKLPEKYRCFFRQVASPNIIASPMKLTELFEILLKLPNHFDDVNVFHTDNISACVQSCLDHTHDGIIREDIFVNWMNREPQTLVWLPTLHRLMATETVHHEAQCNTCKAYPIIGMRYRCLRCFNYDLCQKCFFMGDHGIKHKEMHPTEEYCKQVTPFEDLKAFFEFLKFKMGKSGLKRKERYLTIERSKSFMNTPVHNLTRLVIDGHHCSEQTTKNRQLQNAHHSTTKTETNEILSCDERKIPLTDYNNVSIDNKKKSNGDENSVNQKKIDTTMLNYISVEKKKIPPTKQVESDENDNVPVLMPKQHKPIKKSSLLKQHTEELIRSEHYQLPPKDNEVNNDNEDVNDDEYRPPLPPKQRHQNNASRAFVYDFIGSELQELRATLAQFDANASTV